MINRDLYLTLTRRDPAGWETRQPTDADYARFEAEVITDFGAHTLKAYYRAPLSGTYYR